ncbi:MAG: c-type cytochrome [Pyrinomonadaceae bacterium]
MRSLRLASIIAAMFFFAIACNNTNTATTNPNQTSNSAPTAAAPTATVDEFAAARKNFEKNCVVCHGEKAEGGRVEVEGKKLKVPSLREGHALSHPDEKLVKQITEGDDEMPAFKDKLNPQEISELVRFIRKGFQGK